MDGHAAAHLGEGVRVNPKPNPNPNLARELHAREVEQLHRVAAGQEGVAAGEQHLARVRARARVRVRVRVRVTHCGFTLSSTLARLLATRPSLSCSVISPPR